MDNVLIHIGYHKTATTWLQNRLFVSENPVFEPLSRNSGNQSTLANHFVFGPDSYLLSPFDLNEAVIREELEQIQRLKPELKSKIAVLSHERLSGNPHSSGFDAEIIARRLANVFPGASVLIVIREQRDMILSGYFQYLSAGGTQGLKKYLQTRFDGKRPGFSPHHFDFLPLVKYYRTLFGSGKVKVVPYELFDNKPARFIEEVTSFVTPGSPVEPLAFDEKINSRKNYYVSYKLRALNRFMLSSSLNNYSGLSNTLTEPVVRSLIAAASKIAPDVWNDRLCAELSEFLAEWLGERYCDSNRQLSDLIGLNLEEFGYI
jgi:hypothetical protein